MNQSVDFERFRSTSLLKSISTHEFIRGSGHSSQSRQFDGKPKVCLEFIYLSASDPKIETDQLDPIGAGRSWAELNITEDTVVFATGGRNKIRHASERVNTSSVGEREQTHIGVIQAWDEFCAALNHAAVLLHNADFTYAVWFYT